MQGSVVKFNMADRQAVGHKNDEIIVTETFFASKKNQKKNIRKKNGPAQKKAVLII